MNKAKQKKLITTLILFLSAFSFAYWFYGLFHISTDDAYVNAHFVEIAPRVSGQVSQIDVHPNQYVKAGDNLLELDPAPYLATRDEYQGFKNYADAKVKIAKITMDRNAMLLKTHTISKQENDISIADYESALGEADASLGKLNVAELNLAYTKITAPSSGWITNMNLRIGDAVNANQAIFVLIHDGEFWLDANFEETDIEKIHAGQVAKIHVDMYPSHPFQGVVESISGGSGSAFSLLPPENATGNWVKVTQRIPVRIRITNPDPRYPLRIGASASVILKTSPFSTT